MPGSSRTACRRPEGAAPGAARRWAPFVITLLLLALESCAAPLHGGAPEKRIWGTVETLAHAPGPPPAAVWLVPADRSNAGALFGEAMERVLREQGIAIEPDAPVLAYAATLEAGAGPLLPSPEIALHGSVGSASRADLGLGIGLPLFGEGPEERHLRFAASFALTSPAGAPLWEGRASGASEGYAPSELARAVAELLAARLGISALPTPFAR